MITPHLYKYTLLCILLLGLMSRPSYALHAQEPSFTESTSLITGQVVDPSGKPIELATISLLNATGQFVRGVISDKNGRFSLGITQGESPLKLMIRALGYKPHTHMIDLKERTLGPITLQEDSQVLSDIVVRSKAETIQMNGTTLRANIASSALASLPSAFDILGQLPFVSATEKEITILGRGVPVIYIGHQKIELEEVKQIDPKTIKSVEVLMSPGAEYDASIGAVIRITLKKHQRGHIGGLFRGELTQNYQLGYYLNGNLYWQGNKLELKVGATNWLETGQSDMLLSNELRFLTKNVHTERLQSEHDESKFARAWTALVYNPTHRQELGAKYIFSSNISYDSHGTFSFVDQHNNKDYSRSTGTVSIFKDHPALRHQINAYYHHTLSKDWEIHAEIAGMTHTNNRKNEQTLNYTFPTSRSREVRTHTTNESLMLSSKAYIQGKIFSGKLNAGAEGTYSRYQQTYNLLNPDNPTLLDPSENTNKQMYLSLYLEWSKSLSKLWSLQLGLRGELVRLSYRNQHRDRFYTLPTLWHLFPNLELEYNPSKLRLALDYRSQIQRPSYHQLRSSYTFIDDYLLESGNPYLKPTIKHGLGVSANYEGLSISLRSTLSKNDAVFFMDPHKKNDQVIVVRLINLDTWGHEATLSYSHRWGIWTPTWSVGVRHTSVPGSIYKEYPCARLVWDNIFSLPQGWSIKANIGYLTAGTEYATKLYPSWWIDLAVSKDIGKHWQLSLSSNDVLTTGKKEVDLLAPGVRLHNMNNSDQINVKLSANYHFNVKSRRYRGGSAGQSEAGRM